MSEDDKMDEDSNAKLVSPKQLIERSSNSKDSMVLDSQQSKSIIKCNATGEKFKMPIRPTTGRCNGVKLLKHSDSDVSSENQEAEKRRESEERTGLANAGPQPKELPLAYVEPAWSGKPGVGYSMEVLKSGVIIETLPLKEKSFYLIGRLPSCDLSLAHPTISRHHAVLQYRSLPDADNSLGFYVYDLGSTHGTFWNGNRVRPNLFVKVSGGHILKFGCSQRKYILQAPPEDHEDESEYTVTQLKERRQLELQNRVLSGEDLQAKENESEGIDWGMGEDADEATDIQENPYASINDEELVLDDPKKTLRGWFEREGYDLQYQTEERGIGQFLCWINLPLESITGRSVRAEALVKGKKKESVVQCAMEACRILDKYGLLRQANHEARKRKARNWEEEDYYDSDEDNFLDRTGSVEKKREQRMRLAGKLESKVETHDSLLQKHREVKKRISFLTTSIDSSHEKNAGNNRASTEEDALDAYMSKLTSCTLSKSDISKMKLELQALRKEEEKLLRLLELTRPANLPPMPELPTTSAVTIPSSRIQLSSARKHDVFKHAIHRKHAASFTHPVSRQQQKKEVTERAEEEEEEEETEKEINQEQKEEQEQEQEQEQERQSTDNVNKFQSIGVSENSPIVLEKNRNSKVLGKLAKYNIGDLAGGTPKREQRTWEKRKDSRKSAVQASNEVPYSDNYSTWVPPQDQQGDGRTKLNDKYGY